jgi:hypothetical protein
MLRVLAVVACIVAVIFFVLSGQSGADAHDISWGLVALSAGVGLLALEGAALPGGRSPSP